MFSIIPYDLSVSVHFVRVRAGEFLLCLSQQIFSDCLPALRRRGVVLGDPIMNCQHVTPEGKRQGRNNGLVYNERLKLG